MMIYMTNLSSRESMAAALTLKKEFINEWKTTHLGENNMQSSIVKLREVQSQLEVNRFLYIVKSW